MTKIILGKSDAATVFEILKTPASVLLHPTVIAFHESRGLIYVADAYADAILSHLKETRAPASVSVEPQDRRLARSATYTRYPRMPFQDQKLNRESRSQTS